jgi:NADPH:quinone reductase-like Zn-dependent oxidoreductase
MSTMNAARIHGYGGPEVLVNERAPIPTPGDSDVLVQVDATSVNPFDAAVRAGYLAEMLPLPMPLILGTDISGTVSAVGSEVTGVAVGDRVMGRGGIFRDGAYAEFAVVAATEVALVPDGIDVVSAAAVPHVGITAWQALFGIGGLTSGQTVLIHGAAGGVGHVAAQLAKHRGAVVLGTTSRSMDFVSGLGVDEVIDYENQRFEDVAREVDVVLDTVGGETQERSWATLKPGGILVSVVQPPSEDTAVSHGARGVFLDAPPHGGPILAELAAMMDAGDLTPEIAMVLPLSEIGQAHEIIEQRHTRGKIVIQV